MEELQVLKMKSQAGYQTFDNDIVLQDIIIEEREEELQKINYDFVELNKLQQIIHDAVYSQGFIVDNISSNVNNSAYNVEAGKKQIIAAEEEQKKCSICGCNMCVFVLLLAVIILIAIVAITFVSYQPIKL